MEIHHVPSFLWFITRMILFFYFILCVSPVFSTGKLSSRGHPRLSNASDQEALLGFMSAITDYDGSLSLPTVWKPNVSFCEWAGIVCSRRRQRVVSLNVSSTGLQGTVSPRLGNLSFLKVLDLSNNGFHGHIPYQLGNLFRLEILYLDFNKLQGSIPPTLGGCRRLEFFSSSENNLTENIPSELCILPKLQFFNLNRNNLTGTIPHCLGNISSLDVLALKENNFHGSLPSELGMLSKLTFITLSGNHFSGQLPSSFLSNCTNLQKLDISGNQLSGHIPAELCRKNTQLTIFYLGRNLLNGTIPDSLFNCTNLREIDLGDNQLSGVMSTKFGKLTHLQWLSLGDNKLVSGSTTSFPILSALTNCSSLQQILLYSNHLTGRLPPCIGQLSTSMHALILEFNELTGEIPPEIGNLTSLTLLALDNNKFTGVIPSSLTMLQRLERLYLDSNFLEGNIPIKIGQLKSLGYINLFGNNLWGRIPDFIAGNQQLSYLNLAHNMLSGKIPASIGNCLNLLTLDLSYNKLSGHIPQEVARLANLAFYFNISNNLLDGLVPMELSKMTMLQAIDISANQFTGNISSALGNCKELEYLNLSYNALQGLIPVSLGELQNLQVMDFSFNNLSGGIPMSLANLKMLNHLNFSFNKLSGEVPKGGVFKKIGATAFKGNPRLCGPWAGLSPCSSHRHKSVWHMKRVILPVVAVVIIVVLCLFFGIFWILNCKRHYYREVGTSLNVEHPRISYGEIITATNEFDDANLLGVGNFGKVYKGVLNNGTSVAIKLLNLENEGAYKSFDRECKVLGKVRHRNLIRIITTYSDLQTKALIFPLMPNGSLEKWLYPNGEEESCLSLIQRLNIAIDIAQAMAYLHHHCFMQVLHCDLKPSNVLLGEDMTAYLIDFGIATICFENLEDSALISTHALKGSIGYIPPEYGLGGRVTTKGDVYSYGILLLEMLTRKKPTNNMFVEGMHFQKWVASGFSNQIGEVVDKNLLRTCMNTGEDKDLNCLKQCISVGLLCTKESPEGRPTMMNIVGTLQSIRETFLGVARIPNFQSDITHLLGSTSYITQNNTRDNQSSSTF